MPRLLPIRLIAAFGAGAMLAAILAGFAVGSFLEEGGQLLAMAWGRITLLDLELTFLFGWLWIAWREGSVPRALFWAAAVFVTGALALFGYLLGASLRSDDPIALVLGPRHRSAGTASASRSAGREASD